MNVAEHTPPLVDMRDLTVAFTGGRAPVKAVSGVSLQVRRGETVALIGESGSGKSVTLRTMLMLHAAKRTQLGGKLMVAGRDVLAMTDGELADYRGKVASMIFQEPLLALAKRALRRLRNSPKDRSIVRVKFSEQQFAEPFRISKELARSRRLPKT
jgi:ABC-type microcin C transport system duplicated ATPase subunit YejF